SRRASARPASPSCRLTWWPRALLEQARAATHGPRGDELDDVQRGNRESAVLTQPGHLAVAEGDEVSARARYEAALAIRRRLGEPRSLAISLGDLGWQALRRGDQESAGALLGEALAYARQTGDRHLMATRLLRLGAAALRRGDGRTARAQFVEAL